MIDLQGLYYITGSDLTNQRGNIYCVKEMIKAGAKIIQYREKTLSYREKVLDARFISRMCKEAGVCFIVNDHVEIALLVDADGVHIGQDDLDIQDVRELIGNKIIGVSTHCPEQAQKAVKAGADYIGVGPIFKTTTKDREPVGLEYLDYVVENIKLPFVAIGGIKEHNLNLVLKHHAKCVCLVSDILESADIQNKIFNLEKHIKDFYST